MSENMALAPEPAIPAIIEHIKGSMQMAHERLTLLVEKRLFRVCRTIDADKEGPPHINEVPLLSDLEEILESSHALNARLDRIEKSLEI